VDADGEVRADVAEGGGGVEVPAGEVEAVTRAQGRLDQWFIPCGRLDGIAAGVPRLVAERAGVHGRPDAPTLVAGDLQDEDVVHVVVVAEAGVLGRGDVGVHLHGVAQLGREVLRERQHRVPGPVQPLEDDRGPVGEQGEQLVVGGLVGDRRAHAPALGEGPVRQRGAVLGDPDERSTKPTAGDELVDGVVGEEVGEVAG
jgi:hypothetical protein